MKQYSLKEATELSKIMLRETDEEKRSKLREELILGTLFIPKMFVDNLPSIEGACFDKDDLLSTAYEIWIEIIDNNTLSRSNRMLLIKEKFRHKITNKIFSEVCMTKVAKKNILNKETTINILHKYYEYLKDNEPNDKKLYELISDGIVSNDNNDFENTFYFIKSIINLLGDEIYRLSRYNLDYLYYLIIDAASPFEDHVQDYNNSLIYDDNTFIDNISHEELIEFINNKVSPLIRSDIERDILDSYYFDRGKTKEGILIEYNLTEQKYQYIKNGFDSRLRMLGKRLRDNYASYIPDDVLKRERKQR